MDVGKTTLLRLLAGFELADSGQIILDSQDISLMPPEKRPFNTVFQSYASFPHLNVFDNVAFGLRIQNLPELEIKNRVNEALKLVNLSDFDPGVVTNLVVDRVKELQLLERLLLVQNYYCLMNLECS